MLPALLLALSACAPKIPAPPQAEEHPLLLWRVERAGQVSHLFGTCHLGVALDYALPEPHDQALDHARVVFTEAEVDMSDPGRIIRLLWSDGPGLSERLPPEDWRALAVSVRGTLPASMMEHMQPWVLASVGSLGGSAGGGAKGGKPPEMMDLKVQNRARAHGIPVEHVETLEEQAAMLAKWNDTFLASLHPVTEGGTDTSSALSDLCLRGKVTGLDALLSSEDPMSAALIEARNRAWVPKLVPALDEGGAFIAVGALHMLGDAGLVSLLTQQGFTITQLSTTRPALDTSLPNQSGGLKPAPPAPAQLDAITDQIAGSMAPALCADGQMIRNCFEPDQARCVTRLTADAALCVRQYGDLLPAEGPPGSDFQRGIAGCLPAGLILETVANDRLGDGPVCAAIGAAMKAAGGKGQ